jgi:excisionase family DNA binding protein
LLTVEETAERLKQAQSTVRRKIRAGQIPAVQLGGKGFPIRVDPDGAHGVALRRRRSGGMSPRPKPAMSRDKSSFEQFRVERDLPASQRSSHRTAELDYYSLSAPNRDRIGTFDL